MSKIYKSYITAKNQCEDLVYFVEDDYLHQKNAITEMIYAYERISSQTKRELVLCPSDSLRNRVRSIEGQLLPQATLIYLTDVVFR